MAAENLTDPPCIVPLPAECVGLLVRAVIDPTASGTLSEHDAALIARVDQNVAALAAASEQR